MTTKKRRRAKSAVVPKETSVCPMCGLDFPDRDAATEPIYTCVACGSEGYDCCIAGRNALCPNCEGDDEEQK